MRRGRYDVSGTMGRFGFCYGDLFLLSLLMNDPCVLVSIVPRPAWMVSKVRSCGGCEPSLRESNWFPSLVLE